AAFADFWQTLQAGRPWVGMVKNRRKDGDHYWVLAHVTPYHEGGEHVGYMSVRRKPTRAQVAAAERDYAAMRAGTSRLRVRHGPVIAPDRLRALNPLWRLDLRQRLMLAAAGFGGFGAALVLLASAGLSLPALFGIIAAGTAAAGYSSWWLCRDVVGRLDLAVAHLRDFATGQYTHDIAIDRNDEVGGVLLGLKSMQVRLGFEIEDRRRQAEQMARVLSALDAVPTSVLVSDDTDAIVYANPAARAMLVAAEADLRLAGPTFPATGPDGSPLYALDHDPDAQRARLAGLSAPHQYRIAFGAYTFDVTATPVLSDSGARLG